MDLLSLDSIIITEDKDGSGGFDLNLVDPPEEFMSQEDSIEIQSGDPVNLKNIETEGGFDSTSPPNDVNILSSSMQEKSGPNLAKSMEIGNEDIQITLDDNDGKNGVAVDLFGFHDNNSSPKIDENINATPIELEFNHNNTGEQIFITNLEKENLNTDSDEHVKKTIHPDESLQRSLKEETETPDVNVSLQAASLNEVDSDDIDASLPDMAMQRFRQDSSSGSEFDFELPPVKKKINDSGIGTDTTSQPSPGVDTKPQNSMSEQKTVVIETPPTTTILMTTHTDVSTINSITTYTKKIIEYKEVPSSPTDFHQSSSQKKAADDWENVQTIEAGFMKEGEEIKPTLPESTPLLSYYEMQETVLKEDFKSVKSTIHTTVDRGGFSALKHFLFGPPKMHRNLLPNRENVFCIAASAFSNGNSTHTRALQTVYRCLTGSRFDCSRFGNHWEEIGFQGNDPSTDLRGAGLFGLMNLIYLLRDPKCQMMAKDIYKLSLHPTQNFPFCVMGINMSRITLQSLREDCLNKECNKRKDVLSVVNDFYAGIYLQMYQIWKSQGKTISDSGYVIKHIETEAKKNPQHILKNLEEYLKNKKSSVNLDNMDPGKDNFLSVCETEAGQY